MTRKALTKKEHAQIVEKLNREQEVQNELNCLKNENEQLKAAFKRVRDEKDYYRNQYKKILHSRSWKVLHALQSLFRSKSTTEKDSAYKPQYIEEHTNKSGGENTYATDPNVHQLSIKLRSLGLVERAYNDLIEIVQTGSLNAAACAAWEIALWHADSYTKIDAKKCLDFLKIARIDKESEHIDELRRISIIEAECLHALNHVKEAQLILEESLATQDHPDLRLALANLETNTKAKIAHINRGLKLQNIPGIRYDSERGKKPYDCIVSEPNQRRVNKKQPKVSVIIPAYNAEHTISTAIDSILAQTWTNLEILVVDDCSKDNTRNIIKQYTRRDSRIQLLCNNQNSGPYVSRNNALRYATGEFVTCNDADDWSHQEKIEWQSKHLIANPEVVANMSQSARTFEDFTFYRRGNRGYYIHDNASSFMFRGELVMKNMGYWDSVRFSGDSEFINRAKVVFGDSRIIHMDNSLLSFTRETSGSLTGSKVFGYQGYAYGARLKYRDNYQYFHDNTDSLYVDFPLKKRPFSIPDSMKID